MRFLIKMVIKAWIDCRSIVIFLCVLNRSMGVAYPYHRGSSVRDMWTRSDERTSLGREVVEVVVVRALLVGQGVQVGLEVLGVQAHPLVPYLP